MSLVYRVRGFRSRQVFRIRAALRASSGDRIQPSIQRGERGKGCRDFGGGHPGNACNGVLLNASTIPRQDRAIAKSWACLRGQLAALTEFLTPIPPRPNAVTRTRSHLPTVDIWIAAAANLAIAFEFDAVFLSTCLRWDEEECAGQERCCEKNSLPNWSFLLLLAPNQEPTANRRRVLEIVDNAVDSPLAVYGL